jgi:hypothetical protein
LVSMTASLLYATFFESLLDLPLAEVHSNGIQVTAGAFLELTNCVAIVGIAALLFSILKRHNESLALCYVGFRAVECAVLVAGVISGLLLIPLGQQFIEAGAPEASHFQTIGALVLKGKGMALQMAILICGLGGLILTSMLYQARLIPRLLAGWGFVGYALVCASAVLDVFGLIDTTHGASMLMYVPGGLFEALLFPIWLLVKGFNSSATVSGSA